jgi:hypothetical protein
VEIEPYVPEGRRFHDCANARQSRFTPAKVPEEDVLNEFLKAVIEVYEFKRCGSSLKLLDRISPHFKWPHGTTFQLREGEQEPTVSYINEEAKISLLESLGLMEKESSSIITEDRVAESNVKTPDQSWKRVPLTDMGLKFAVSTS